MKKPDFGTGFELCTQGGLSWLEYELNWYRAIFSLARTPDDAGNGRVLDLGRTVEEPSTEVLSARSDFCRAAGIDAARVRIARQVHGERLLDLGSDEASATTRLLDRDLARTEADGFMVSSKPPTVAIPAIVTADCLAVVIAGSGGSALLHLGWRGLATDLLERAVLEIAGSEAVIGPAIGPCCYEVGPEVFLSLGQAEMTGPGPLDLPSIARERLLAVGVGRVASTGLCTACEKDLLFSHRRDGEGSGRQMALVIGPR